jgi:SAM-dependent methyltransferase
MTESDVEAFFAKIGISRPKSEAVFIKRGRKRFGDAFDKVMSVIAQRAAGNKIDPYDLKNASLDLSLYVGEQYTSETWRAFAQWIVREQLPAPERVLDLGCESGVVSCLLATLWPQSQILGIDRSGSAISAARGLATWLGLKNVTFAQSDNARQYLAQNPNTFSIVLATLVMHELLNDPNAREPFTWTYVDLEDIHLTDADEFAISVLHEVRKSVVQNGLLISLDRSHTSATSWWYAQCLEQAGMRVSLRHSYKVDVKDAYSAEKFPITVAINAAQGWPRTTAEEILSLTSFPELSALSLTLKEDVADLFIRSLGHTEIMFEAAADYVDKSGIRTIRLLKTATMLVLHDFTNHGYKTAFVAPLVALPTMRSHCQDIARDLENNAEVTSAVTEAGEALLTRLSYEAHEP